MKRTPLTRRKPPQRLTPLPPGGGLSPARELKRGETKPRPPRNTGPAPDVRRTVVERAGGCCERCGKTLAVGSEMTAAYSIHHRKPRGMGGTKNPAANSPANLVLLCGSATTPDGCHTSVEKFRQAALTTGYIVSRTADPQVVPIKMVTGWWFLRADGTKLPTVRPEQHPE